MKALAGVAIVAAALLTAGCASEGTGWRSSWDPDAPVVPVREGAGTGAEPGGQAAGGAGDTVQAPPSRLRRYVVLLPDADGRVGAVDVATPDGAVHTLSRAGQAFDFDEPSRQVDVTAAEAAAAGAAALAVEPPPPEGFVLLYDVDSDAMTAQSRAAWAAIAAAIAERPAPEVTVSGHADRSGDGEHNAELSRRRAEAVRDLLIAAGVDPAWIEVAWYGETRPAVATADGVAEPRNRRVELRVR